MKAGVGFAVKLSESRDSRLVGTKRRTKNALDNISNSVGSVVARIYRARWRWADSYPACACRDRTRDQSGVRQTSGLGCFRRKGVSVAKVRRKRRAITPLEKHRKN